MSEFEHTMLQLMKQLVSDNKKIVSLLEGPRRKKSPLGKKWIDRIEVEELLGRHKNTIDRYTEQGILKAKRIGSMNWYYKPDILKRRDQYVK